MTNNKAALISLLLIFLGVGLLLPPNALAQSGTTGTLTGVVRDPNNAALPGVTVTVTNLDTSQTRTVTTNDSGEWTVPVLPVGRNYEVSYEIAGFSKLVRQQVEVEASVPRTLEDRLEIGEVGATVTVEGGPSLTSPETATTFRQLTDEELVAVPTSTRSFTHLLSAEAGVSADLPPVSTNGNGNISPSVNGTRTTSTSLFFNGIDATNITNNEGSLNDNIAPAPETLSEVKLQTSLYDASTGRSGGGNFQLVTKSGTNSFNGSVYYYLQNERFNANDFFYNKEGIDKPRARRHEGGFTIGGPIIKDKLFFFGGYQRTRASTGFVTTASSQTVLPAALGLISGPRTPENIVAAFSSLNPCVRNGAGVPVSGFCLTPSQISPIAINLLNVINPVTGDFLIPSPRAGIPSLLRDQTPSGVTNSLLFGGNPIIRQRNVFPAEFEQDQFTIKLDSQLTTNNRLSGTFFFTNFPGFDPFPDPNSLASPVGLVRGDRNRTLAISDTHIFSPTLINEVRFGYFMLNNTRQLSDEFAAITNESVGVPNPATFFDNSTATQRLGHYIGRNRLANFSFGGPNDSFNRRKQQTYSISDNLTWVTGNHTFRFGAEFKKFQFDTNLPEEQATEFEKFDNFTQLLAGRATEADTQFGITDKTFRFKDYSFYIADDWKFSSKLTFNLGLRYEFFGLPEEQNGRFGNFNPNLLTNTENPLNAFVIPANAQTTGFVALDEAVNATQKANNNHTLNGQDRNNFAPRIGFAFSPFDDNRLVVRGGYGVFFDRPSAAFINTVFSNYPYLREIEVTAPSRLIRLETAFSQQNPLLGLNNYLPNRIQLVRSGSTLTYVIRDNTGVTLDANGIPNAIDLVTGQPSRGNIAETFEFRAVDPDLRTPYVQQWNIGAQFELTKNLVLEARYVGTKGTKLLQAIALNEVFNLNNPNAPDYIFKRFNDAYNAAYLAESARTGNPNVLRGPLRNAGSERDRGLGIAFGFANPFLAGLTPTCSGSTLNIPSGSPIDFNLSSPLTCGADGVLGGGPFIGFEARGAILGFNIPEALLLQSSGNSIYHGLQLNLTQRLTRGLQFNASYTFSKSIDTLSTDPGSTAGSGKPDVPNAGFILQNNSRDARSNRARSDFDRPHRFSMSFVYDVPSFGSNSKFMKGWQIAGFAQLQSGTPFSIFSAEPELANALQLNDIRLASGGLFRPGFGRPNLCGSLDELGQSEEDPTEGFFNPDALCSPLGEYGNLGRNALRGPSQKRFDLSFSKTTTLSEGVNLQFRWDVFNVFNTANFGNPSGDLQDTTDFGRITNTVGGPRVMQFGLKLNF